MNTPTTFETITSAFTNISSLVTSVVSAIVANEILVIFMAAGFLALGLRMFKALKGTAKSN